MKEFMTVYAFSILAGLAVGVVTAWKWEDDRSIRPRLLPCALLLLVICTLYSMFALSMVEPYRDPTLFKYAIGASALFIGNLVVGVSAAFAAWFTTIVLLVTWLYFGIQNLFEKNA